MNMVYQRYFWFYLGVAALSCSLLLACQNPSEDTRVTEGAAHNAPPDEGRTTASNIETKGGPLGDANSPSAADCDSSARRDLSGQMRARTTKDGQVVAVALGDTLGFVLEEVFSAPGEWDFLNRESLREAVFEGSSNPIQVDVLRYYCDDTSPNYPNCGKPESIGTSGKSDDERFIFIYFKYDVCGRNFRMSYYGDTVHNHSSAKAFLRHHHFPPADTVEITLRKIEL